MKAAICFFGLTRNLKQHTLHSIENLLERPVASKDPGYRKFGHFNRIRTVSNPRTGEKNVSVDIDEYKLLNCEWVRLSDADPPGFAQRLEEIKRFGDAWGDGFVSLGNLLRQLYSLNEVTSLLMESGIIFDLVVYSRVDIRFEREVVIPAVQPGRIYTPYFGRNGGLNDRFALGDMATMVRYGQRYSLVNDYCRETGQPLHSEKFLKWCVKKHCLRDAVLTSTEFRRIRANGQIAPNDVNLRPRRIRRLINIARNFVRGERC
jgi:hypothetical protein